MEDTVATGISDLIADIPSVLSLVWDLIISNPVLSFIAGCSVLTAGIGVYFAMLGRRKKR